MTLAKPPSAGFAALALFLTVGSLAPPAFAQAPQPQNPARQTPPRDAPAQFGQPAGTARITGRVVALDTGRPVKNARVAATAQGVRGRFSALTNENGGYELTELPAGRYTVMVSKAGYITLQYGQRRPRETGTPLQVEDRQELRNVNFALPRGSVITGHVLDEDGAPLPLARVTLYRFLYVQGDQQLVPAGSDTTDDRGAYRVFDLEPGEYFVSATVPRQMLALPPGAAERIQALGPGPGPGGGPGLGPGGGQGPGAIIGLRAAPGEPVQILDLAATDGEPMGYAPTYYPGVTNLVEAMRIPVGVGQEAAGIDFAVQLVPTARISGVVFGPDGAAAGGSQVMLLPAEGGLVPRAMPLAARVQPDGGFDVNNVPPGRYFIRATSRGARRAGNDPLFASQEINVDGRDLADVTLILSPGAQVEGLITFEGNTQPQSGDLTRVRITSLPLEPQPLGGALNVLPNRDGTFVLTGVSAGPRLIRATGLPEGWALKAVYFDGRDVTDTPLDFGGVQRATGLHVALTDRVSTLSGAVHDTQGQPLTQLTVVAFPTDSTFWRPRSRHIQASRPDQNGRFQVRGLPAGDYLLAAVDAVEQGEWFDPAFLDRLRDGAMRVSLRERESKAVTLSMDVQPR